MLIDGYLAIVQPPALSPSGERADRDRRFNQLARAG